MNRAWTAIFIVFFAQSLAGQISADLVLVNANIRTLDAANPRAEAIAIANGRIIAVGQSAAMRLLAGKQSRIIDARGKLVIPGFNDAHVHFTAIGNRFSYLDLREVRSIAEVAERITYFSRFLPKGRWLLGGGLKLDPSAMADGAALNLIDSASRDNPVLIYFADSKIAIVNSAAMKLAGMLAPGGIVTGAAITRIRRSVPPGHEKNWAEIAETASRYAASLGVTSVQDMHSDELAAVYRDLHRDGKLRTRIYDCSPLSSVPRLRQQGVKAASGDGFVRTGCIKHFSDGDYGEAQELQKAVLESDRAGLQIMIHAIGPSANAIVIDTFEKLARDNGIRDRRFRIEHAHNMRRTDISRLARSRIVASMQPWLFHDGGGHASIYNNLLELRTLLAFGSDASITDFNPLLGIYAAVSGKSGITVEQAVRAYTVGSAYAEFQDHLKGTLTVGKFADLIVLSDDIFSIDRNLIPRVRVEMTIVDGKVVFEAAQ